MEIMQTNGKVFIAYSWDNESHRLQVHKLVAELREKGVDAEIDILISQRETAIDFKRMMHKVCTDYERVIIILSEGYKQKAESFSSGVGYEYGLIIKDIDQCPNKYILVSFSGIKDEIVPLMFRGREVIDLQNFSRGEFNKLYGKVFNVPTLIFPNVAERKIDVETKKINGFLNDKILYNGVECQYNDSSQLGGLYKWLSCECTFNFKNCSNEIINGKIKIEVPDGFVKNEFSYSGKNIADAITPFSEVFPEELFSSNPIKLYVDGCNAYIAQNSKIKITLYAKDGPIKYEVPVFDCIKISEYGTTRSSLTAEDFTLSL